MLDGPRRGPAPAPSSRWAWPRPADPLVAVFALLLAGCSQPALSNIGRGPPGENCTWPECAKRREACETKKVGTCVMPLPGCDNKQAVCQLGRCNCPTDFCAVPGTKECVPQKTYSGARPPRFHHGLWLNTLVGLGHPGQFPKMWELEDEYIRLVSPWCLPAVALCLVGLLVAHFIGMALCSDVLRCRCCDRRQSHGEFEVTLCGLAWIGTPLRSKEGIARRVSRREPWCLPVVVSTLLVLALCVVSVFMRETQWSKTRELIGWQVRHARTNATSLNDQTTRLNETAFQLHEHFVDVSHCRHNPLMRQVGSSIFNATADLAKNINAFHLDVKNYPGHIDTFWEFVVQNEAKIVWFPCAPLILMGTICLFMLIEVVCTRYFANSITARYEEMGFAACAGVFVFIIICVTAASGAMLSVLIGAAQICTDIDTNAVTTAWKFSSRVNESMRENDPGWNTDPYDIVRHYIKGDTYNPLFSYLEEIKLYIDSVVDLYVEYEASIVKPQALSCPALLEIDLFNIKDVIDGCLSTARDLLSVTNIYPFYDEIVHVGICNHLLASYTAFLILQVVGGVILFPLCAVLSYNYLDHHVAAQLDTCDSEGGTQSPTSDDSSDEDDHVVKKQATDTTQGSSSPTSNP